MIDYLSKYRDRLTHRDGLESIISELMQQTKHALLDVDQVEKLATAIQKTGKVLLLGMGASHFINCIFSLQLRRLGYQAFALTASEFLAAPLVDNDCVVILTSQSGKSIETTLCLQHLSKSRPFAVTLDPESVLARNCQVLVPAGGVEHAFAGTRSVLLSLAVFAQVASRLGAFDKGKIAAALKESLPNYSIIDLAVTTMSQATAIVINGKGILSGLAKLFCLGCQELSREIAFGYETGQFRHGPMEILQPSMLLIGLRASTPAEDNSSSLQQMSQISACPLMVIDASRVNPIDKAVSIPCGSGNDMCTVLSMLPLVQVLMIAYACCKNPCAGVPRYCTKVTVIA